MAWQRSARAVIAVVGLGFAGTLYFVAHRRPPTPAPAQAVRRDPNIDYQQGPGAIVRTKEDKEVAEQQCLKTTHMVDGRTVCERAHFIFDRGGRQFVMTSDTAESQAAPGADAAAIPTDTTFKGHVKIEVSDGLVMLCDVATYNDTTGIVQIPGLVTFARGRMSGRGVGATYERTPDVLRLLDQASVNTKADPQGHGVLHASSKTLVLTRPDHHLQLDDHAEIVRDGQTMHGNHAMVLLTDDNERARRIELREQSSVTQPPTETASGQTMRAGEIDMDFVPEESRMVGMAMRGQSSVVPAKKTVGGSPEMHADAITIEFQPDGHAVHRATLNQGAQMITRGTDGDRNVKADVILATLGPDGQRATGLDGKGNVVVQLPEGTDPPTPGRLIHAQRLETTGSDTEGLTSATFSGGVDFREVSPASTTKAAIDRRTTVPQMTLKLNGDLDSISAARFSDDFKFIGSPNDPANRVEAHAGQANYIFGETNELRLAPRSGRGPEDVPHVETHRITVDASALISLDTDKNDMHAGGVVSTKTKVDANAVQTGTASAPGLFDNMKPIVASASAASDALVYRDSDGQAIYTGKARVGQGDNFVRADRITIANDSGNIEAVGQANPIATVFLLDATPGSTPSTVTTPSCPIAGATCMWAKSLTYDDTTRIATYKTDVRLEGLNGQQMKAGAIQLVLAKEGRSLDKAIADGTVVAGLPPDRKVAGDHLKYYAADDRYEIQGTALKFMFSQIENGKPACHETQGKSMTFLPDNDGLKRKETFSVVDENGHETFSRPVPCAVK